MPSNAQMTFHGRYSDGQTAAGKAASIFVGADSLHVTPEGMEAPLHWAYDGLNVSIPLTSRDTHALLTSSEHPGATLFVDSRMFVLAIRLKAPHLGAGSMRWRYARPALLVTAILALITLAIYAFDFKPAKHMASFMPEGMRDRMGRNVMLGLVRKRKECNAPAGRAALDKLVRKLVTASGGQAKFKVHVVDWGLVNAFAVPGNRIVMTRGLIKKAASADEVAGVLAHEMGHGLELHPETGVVRAIGMTAALQLIFAGGTETLGNIGSLLLQLKFSRGAEREADAQAFRILKGAKITPTALADFFKRISTGALDSDAKDGEEDKDGRATKTKGDGTTRKPEDKKSPKKKRKKPSVALTRSLQILSTHPPLPEREALARKQGNYKTEPALSKVEWARLGEICGKDKTGKAAKEAAKGRGKGGDKAKPTKRPSESGPMPDTSARPDALSTGTKNK